MNSSPCCLARKVFSARADQLTKVRSMIRQALERQGCATQFVSAMVLAVNEACMNVVQHGYAGTQTGDFTVEVLCAGNLLTFRITDSAPPIAIATVVGRDPAELRPGGLGVFLMREIMDQVAYTAVPNGSGNILEMKKRITPTVP